MSTLKPEARRAKVVSLREQGLSFREIGRQLGVSHELARQDARAEGLTALTVAPDGLGARGLAFWEHARAAFEMDRHEQELVVQVCRLMDRADALQADVSARGVMVETRSGPRPNPAITEERQISLALGRMLAQLEIPSEDSAGPAGPRLRSGWSQRAQKAAESRWHSGGAS